MTNHFQISERRFALIRVGILTAACACSASAMAQDAGAAGGLQSPKGPDEQIAAAVPPGRLARAFSWGEAQIDGRAGAGEGWYPEMGGMIPGAGFSLGPGYRQRLFGDQLVVDASAAVSWNGYRMMQSQLTWPHLSNDRLSVGAQMKYQDFTQINFFGIGNATQKDDQTDYRLKNVDALGFATVRATPWLSITGSAGTLRGAAIAPGTSTLHPSTDERFNESTAPGLTHAPNYLHADVALDVDTRDVPDYPSSGGRYRLSVAMFHDQDQSGHSFRRAEAEAAHYIPIGPTTLALRGRLDLSQSGADQTVPFFMLPSLGGANSLRGYLDYRFRDQDAMLLDAEYRWPLHRNFDAALFYDAGAVAPSASALSGHLNSDYGVGIRVHSAKHLLVRLDVARGGEGTRALVTFSAPLGPRSNNTLAPYVP